MAVFAQLFARARAANALASTASTASSSSISVNSPIEPSSSLLGESGSSSSSSSGHAGAGVFGMGRLRRVVLSWTVRAECELQPFAELLWHVSQNNPFDAFELDIHVTQPATGAALSASSALKSSEQSDEQSQARWSDGG
jgi:hypothetical protein